MKISIIMPVYNSEKYLRKSVESVMNQTLDDIELITVNDASTDNSLVLLEELQSEHKDKMRVINLQTNIRQGGARNVGLDAAKGEYIAFVDSDDWIEKDMLADFWKLAEEYHSDMIGTRKYYNYFSDNDIRQVDLGTSKIMSEFHNLPFTPEMRNRALFLLGGTCLNLYKRSIIEDNNLRFPEKMSYEDNFFITLFVMYIRSYSCVDKAYLYYRQHAQSTTKRVDSTQYDRIKIEKMLLTEAKERGLYKVVKDGYELRATKIWYINTIGILYHTIVASGSDADINRMLTEFSNEFLQYFPDYRKNKYYKTEISTKDRIKLRLLEISPWLLTISFSINNKLNLARETVKRLK